MTDKFKRFLQSWRGREAAKLLLLLVVMILLSACKSRNERVVFFDMDNNPNAVQIESLPNITQIESVTQLEYGVSGSGKHPLIAYKIGNGENVLLLTFAIHGYEDNFDRDGEALVYLATELVSYLGGSSYLADKNNWTVYVLPCLNPDGLYNGNSCNGAGRCTTWYYNEDGVLVNGDGLGIDMNRSFPYRFEPASDARYFNGTTPLQCPESQALANFASSIKGSGYNVSIDVHGWYQQILTTGGTNSLYQILKTSFPECSYASLEKGNGYLSAWCGYILGYDSALLELPADIYSMEEFKRSEVIPRFLQSITTLLETY